MVVTSKCYIAGKLDNGGIKNPITIVSDVQDLNTKKERLFAKSHILHEFAKRLRVE